MIGFTQCIQDKTNASLDKRYGVPCHRDINPICCILETPKWVLLQTVQTQHYAVFDQGLHCWLRLKHHYSYTQFEHFLKSFNSQIFVIPKHIVCFPRPKITQKS